MTKTEFEAVKKIIDWFEAQAKRDDIQAKNCRFNTLTAAYMADTKNYRKMASDLRKVAVITQQAGD